MIDKIYYINADDAVVRREWMEGLLQSQSIVYERFPAVMATRDHLNEDLVSRIATGQPDLQLGTLGCWLSHYELVKIIMNKHRDENILILEDDVDLIPGWYDKLRALNNQGKFGKNWDIIRSCWHSKRDSTVEKINFCHELSKHYSPQDVVNKKWKGGGTHFQILNGKTIDNVYRLLSTENIYAIDWTYTTTAINVFHTHLAVINIDVEHVEDFRPTRTQRCVQKLADQYIQNQQNRQ